MSLWGFQEAVSDTWPGFHLSGLLCNLMHIQLQYRHPATCYLKKHPRTNYCRSMLRTSECTPTSLANYASWWLSCSEIDGCRVLATRDFLRTRFFCSLVVGGVCGSLSWLLSFVGCGVKYVVYVVFFLCCCCLFRLPRTSSRPDFRALCKDCVCGVFLFLYVKYVVEGYKLIAFDYCAAFNR